MLLQLYGLASLTVFTLAIGPFWRDPSNPKAHLGAWLFLGLAMVMSPITLPNMIVQRLWRRGRPLVRAFYSFRF
ncbi:MAG: hypothetical protein ACFCVD_13210 [Nodosilinea sp.]